MAFRLTLTLCLALAVLERVYSLHIGNSGYGGYGTGLYNHGLSGIAAGGVAGGYPNYLDNSGLSRFFSAAGIRMPGLNANLASPASFNFGVPRPGGYGFGVTPAYGGPAYTSPAFSYGAGTYGTGVGSLYGGKLYGDVGVYGGDAGIYSGDAGIYGGDAGIYGGDTSGFYGGDVGLGDSFYSGGLGNNLGATYGDVGTSYGLNLDNIPTEVYDPSGSLVSTIPAGDTSTSVYRSPVASSRPTTYSSTNGVTSVYSSTTRFSDRSGPSVDEGAVSTDARSFEVPAEPSDPLPLDGAYQGNPTVGNANVYRPPTYGTTSTVYGDGTSINYRPPVYSNVNRPPPSGATSTVYGDSTISNYRPPVYSGTASNTNAYDSTSQATAGRPSPVPVYTGATAPSSPARSGPTPLYNTQLGLFPNNALQYTGNTGAINLPAMPNVGSLLRGGAPLLRGAIANSPVYSNLLRTAINAGVYGPAPGQLPTASVYGQGLVGQQQPARFVPDGAVVPGARQAAVDEGDQKPDEDAGPAVVNQGPGMYTNNVVNQGPGMYTSNVGNQGPGMYVSGIGAGQPVGAVVSQTVNNAPTVVQGSDPKLDSDFGFSADGFYYDNAGADAAPLVVGYLSHGFRKSCGNFYYDPRYQGCCDGTTYVYGTHKCCPGYGVYAKANQQCVNGALQEYSPVYQASCSGNFYDHKTQGCCGGSVYSYDGFECCGGTTIYHIGDMVCDGVQLYNIDSNAYTQLYNEAFYRDFAMGGTQYKLSPGDRDNFFAPVCGTSQYIGFASGCCDGNVYKYGTQLCCHGNSGDGVHQYYVSTVENGCGNNAARYYGDFYSMAKNM